VRKRTGLFSHHAQAHELSAIVRKRTSFQPSCTSARAFSHCAQAHKLSAIVRKRMLNIDATRV
jgi:hypothetical protein